MSDIRIDILGTLFLEILTLRWGIQGTKSIESVQVAQTKKKLVVQQNLECYYFL